jgi:hypothetical protein
MQIADLKQPSTLESPGKLILLGQGQKTRFVVTIMTLTMCFSIRNPHSEIRNGRWLSTASDSLC